MDNKFTLITGGSEGLGLELAKLFAKDSHNLILVARNMERLQRVKCEIENLYKVRIEIINIDLSMDNSCEKLIKIVEEKNIIVDNLINNLGIGSYGFFHEERENFEDEIIDINIKVLTKLSKYYIKKMINKGGGRILNIASTAAFIGGPKMALYYATKAYVLSLSEALFEEGKRYNVLVSCLCPGAIKTNFQSKAGIKKSHRSKGLLMNADRVAIEAYRDFNRGKAIIIPGIKNRIAVFASKISPRGLSRKIIMKNNIE